jgi:DNA polymerase III delta prime subunit
MQHNGQEFLWVEKWRPQKIEDCILSANLKATFQQFVDQRNVPNLLLAGSAGVGKTTVARAMLEEIGSEYIIINGSNDRNIDTLRNEVGQFASTMSLMGDDSRRMIILDEADYLNPQSFQPAFRYQMEVTSKNCGYILTCNHEDRIIPEIHSRCSVIKFGITGEEKAQLAAAFLHRVEEILEFEKVEYDKRAVAELIMKHFPDWRRCLNELQRYSASGKIDTGILVQISDNNFLELIKMIKAKEFTSMRKWVGVNTEIEFNSLCRKFYNMAYDIVKDDSIPVIILIIGEYQRSISQCADPEIQKVCMLTEMMQNVEWK